MSLDASVKRRRRPASGGGATIPRDAKEYDEFPLLVSPVQVPWFEPGFGQGARPLHGSHPAYRTYSPPLGSHCVPRAAVVSRLWRHAHASSQRSARTAPASSAMADRSAHRRHCWTNCAQSLTASATRPTSCSLGLPSYGGASLLLTSTIAGCSWGQMAGRDK